MTALRKLPVGQRTVVVLRYYSDLSIEQTAAALGCSVGNVKSQRARGLAALRGHLDAADELETNQLSRRRSPSPTTYARTLGVSP